MKQKNAFIFPFNGIEIPFSKCVCAFGVRCTSLNVYCVAIIRLHEFHIKRVRKATEKQTLENTFYYMPFKQIMQIPNFLPVVSSYASANRRWGASNFVPLPLPSRWNTIVWLLSLYSESVECGVWSGSNSYTYRCTAKFICSTHNEIYRCYNMPLHLIRSAKLYVCGTVRDSRRWGSRNSEKCSNEIILCRGNFFEKMVCAPKVPAKHSDLIWSTVEMWIYM